MNYEAIAFIIVFIPLFWIVVFQQEKIGTRKGFLKCLVISISTIIFGVFYEYFVDLDEDGKSYVYFMSQTGFIFVILYKLVRIPYFKIYNREPEIAEYPEKWVDIIPTIIVYMGTLLLPFVIDSYIIQKLLD